MKLNLPRLLLGLTCLLIAIWLVAPTLVIIPMSFAGKKSLVLWSWACPTEASTLRLKHLWVFRSTLNCLAT